MQDVNLARRLSFVRPHVRRRGCVAIIPWPRQIPSSRPAGGEISLHKVVTSNRDEKRTRPCPRGEHLTFVIYDRVELLGNLPHARRAHIHPCVQGALPRADLPPYKWTSPPPGAPGN